MRTFALTLAAAFGAVAILAPTAQAGPTTLEMKVKPASSKGGSKKKPRSNGLAVTLNADPAGDYAAKRAIVSLDRRFKFNTSKFPSCKQSVVQANPAKCPSGSKVGTGKAVGIVAALGNLRSDLVVTAYNGGNNKLFMRVETDEPVLIESVLVGTLKSASGKYGKKLDVAIPENLQNIAGAIPTLTHFFLNVRKTHKRTPYVQSTGCNKGKWHFAAQVFYTDNTDKKDHVSVTCRS